jgi:hypothetical protein
MYQNAFLLKNALPLQLFAYFRITNVVVAEPVEHES